MAAADRFYKKLNEQAIFSHTAYSSPKLIDVCERPARQALAKAGGRIEKGTGGEDVFVVSRQTHVPSKFEDLKSTSPMAGSVYSEDEKARMQPPPQP